MSTLWPDRLVGILISLLPGKGYSAHSLGGATSGSSSLAHYESLVKTARLTEMSVLRYHSTGLREKGQGRMGRGPTLLPAPQHSRCVRIQRTAFMKLSDSTSTSEREWLLLGYSKNRTGIFLATRAR